MIIQVQSYYNSGNLQSLPYRYIYICVCVYACMYVCIHMFMARLPPEEVGPGVENVYIEIYAINTINIYLFILMYLFIYLFYLFYLII